MEEIQDKKGIKVVEIYSAVRKNHENEWKVIYQHERQKLGDEFDKRSWKQIVIRRFIDDQKFPNGGDHTQDHRRGHSLVVSLGGPVGTSPN